MHAHYKFVLNDATFTHAHDAGEGTLKSIFRRIGQTFPQYVSERHLGGIVVWACKLSQEAKADPVAFITTQEAEASHA